MATKRFAAVGKYCVACGVCIKVCPMSAISIWKGVVSQVNKELCIGCGKCVRECPAGTTELKDREEKA